MADVDPALGQEILDVAEQQRVSHVHHHDQTDDLRRAVKISERIAHGPSLPRPEAPRAFGLTEPVAMVRGHHAEAVDEAIARYMNWPLYRHEPEPAHDGLGSTICRG